MKLRCVVFGADGFDLDVAFNLMAFYEQLGYSTVLSRELIPTDLLVIHRPPNSPLNLEAYGSVHVWDYVGTSIESLLPNLAAHPNVTIFASSGARTSALVELAPALEGRIHELLPPVATELWELPIRETRYNSVHIGNFKPSYAAGKDAPSSEFLHVIERNRIDVWGAKWPLNSDLDHGPARLHEVSKIYGQSSYALGMMYPFQREITLSGRFWHAPLNGCLLFTERSIFSQEVPGVKETDYTSWLTSPPLGRVAQARLQRKAHEYWHGRFVSAQIEVKALIAREPSPLNLPKATGGQWVREMVRSRAMQVKHLHR